MSLLEQELGYQHGHTHEAGTILTQVVVRRICVSHLNVSYTSHAIQIQISSISSSIIFISLLPGDKQKCQAMQQLLSYAKVMASNRTQHTQH